jgi:hypothetical protein
MEDITLEGEAFCQYSNKLGDSRFFAAGFF